MIKREMARFLLTSAAFVLQKRLFPFCLARHFVRFRLTILE